MEAPKQSEPVSEANLPEWETTARHRGEKGVHYGVRDRAMMAFNRYVPAYRKYCGLSRKIACIVLLAILVAILALVIGLAVGLSKRSNNHQTLPLGSQTYTGDLTYYGPGLGACGVTSGDNDHIVSISHFVFDAVSTGSNPNANPLCGHKLRAVRDGNSIDLTVVDRCVGCKPTDIDVSPGAFKQLADSNLGRVVVTWAWLPPVPPTP
ncbi:hypothetical protein N7G274_010210 [Stereocaulon virgatum]|uniref:RlpA-like protein double-psi beta-barrel domain-containing protein n=1 Tax=Stereocaulon virgatum TaxID=373712 RepID=A0ABR3ZWF7_9LECA